MSPTKGNILVLVLGGLAIILAAGMVYVFFQNQQLANQPPTPIPTVQPQGSPVVRPTDETASWKTYTIDQIGVTFMYPEAWFIDGNALKYLYVSQDRIPADMVDSRVSGYLMITIANDKRTLDEIKKEKKPEPGYLEIKDTKIDQLPAIKVVERSPQPITTSQTGFTTTVIFVRKGYRVEANYPNEYNRGGDTKIFDQILSTFKFTDSANNLQQNTNPLPPVVFKESGSVYSQDIKDQIYARVINPYIAYTNTSENKSNNQDAVSITISQNQDAKAKTAYPYTMEAITRNGGTYGMAISLKNGVVNWWAPDCMGSCNFSSDFKSKYPEIVKLVGE